MFKKRSKRPENTTSRPRSASGAEEGEGHEGDSVVQDLLALRRMKAAEGAGIQADKLNSGPQAGPSSSKKRKLAPGAAVDSEQELAAAASVAPMESLAKKNNFTQQMNLIDVDKHMMDYIESEMKKRQGQGQGGEDAAQADKKKDPRDELYAIDEKYRLKEKPLAEGNVTGSTAMLTAIPEVDLGIDSRLRNIEATEKAKRSLFEAEQRAAHQIGPTKAQAEADNYARQRFYHPEARDLSSGGGMPTRRSEKDYERDAAELLKKARAQAAARKEAGEEDTLLDEEVDEAEQHRRLVNELKSTDDQVVARFKTRQRENNAKQQRGIVWNR